MKRYQHDIREYRADTAHLTLLEHGVYRQLLDWYYLDEGPLPLKTDLVMRRLSARTPEEKTAVQAVLDDFFTLTDEGYRHYRCEQVLRDRCRGSLRNASEFIEEVIEEFSRAESGHE